MDPQMVGSMADGDDLASGPNKIESSRQYVQRQLDLWDGRAKDRCVCIGGGRPRDRSV